MLRVRQIKWAIRLFVFYSAIQFSSKTYGDSLPKESHPNGKPIAAVGLELKGKVLIPPGLGPEISFIVGIPFKFMIPLCGSVVLQHSEFLKESEIPFEFNPSASTVLVKTTLETTIAKRNLSNIATNSCSDLKIHTQMIEVQLGGRASQKLFATIIKIPIIPPGKSLEETILAKVLVLYSAKKNTVQAALIEDDTDGYLATYLRLAVLTGEL